MFTLPTLSRPIAFVLVLAAPAALAAQQAPPGPAPELQQLAPLIGNWHGTGSAHFGPGAPPTAWQARGSYRWSHDGYFVQEDFEITFAGQPAPLVFRAYFGWDREHRRFVNAMANNAGEVRLNDLVRLPDGTMLQILRNVDEGVPYAERALFKVDGDTMTHSIDMLMPSGPSLTVVDGTFERGGDGFPGSMQEATFQGKKAAPAIARLGRCAGTYSVAGEMVMAADMPSVKIAGTDTAQAVWGGTVVHIHTEGTADGMPGQYRGDVLWGQDAARECLVAVYVSNMGEVMTMDAHWSKDGKLVAMSIGQAMGEPIAQRTILEFDAKGAPTTAITHALSGTSEPLVSFRAKYLRD